MNRYPAPHSILIIDNASIHHTQAMRVWIHFCGCLVIYLPPYCPYLNLVEYVFNGVKMMEKKYEIHERWQSYLSLMWSVESMKQRNWLQVLRKLTYCWMNDLLIITCITLLWWGNFFYIAKYMYYMYRNAKHALFYTQLHSESEQLLLPKKWTVRRLIIISFNLQSNP